MTSEAARANGGRPDSPPLTAGSGAPPATPASGPDSGSTVTPGALPRVERSTQHRRARTIMDLFEHITSRRPLRSDYVYSSRPEMALALRVTEPQYDPRLWSS